MVIPISCNECRRRKIRCDRVQPCKNCSLRSVPCTYPSKFRSIEINKMKENGGEVAADIEYYKQKIDELEKKLATSEDLISIFDTTGNSCTKYFGANSILSLESEMMYGIFPFVADRPRNINGKKKDLPLLIEGNDERNKQVIRSLVGFFFKEDQYYYFNEIFDKNELMDFLDNYDSIVVWSHDEDLMVLCAILVDVLKDIHKSGQNPMIPYQEEKVKCTVNYYYQLSKSQEYESVKLIKSQVLLLNYYYYDLSFEKCWKLIFQILSNAYSLGVHLNEDVLWTKINVMEALLCSASSRPNAIQGIGLMGEQQKLKDELKEYKLCEVLRLKNGAYVSSYVNNTEVPYEMVLGLDAMYDEYTSFLVSKFVRRPDPDDLITIKRNEKIDILLLLCYSTQVKIHYEYFEKRQFSENKICTIIDRYLGILEDYVYGRLNSLRDKFSALECFFYQFLLIFLKYLNFKSVSFMMRINTGSNEIIRKQEISGLSSLQNRLKNVLGKNNFDNDRINKICAIILSINLSDMKSENLNKGSNGSLLTPMNLNSPKSFPFDPFSVGSKESNYYASNELKGFMEESNFNLLRSIMNNTDTSSPSEISR